MAIKLGDAIVYLKGDRSQLKRDLDAGKADTKGWTQAVGTMAGSLMAGAITGGATLALGAVSQLGRGFVSAIQDATGIEGVRNTFDNLAASIGTDSVTAMNLLRDATRGMVADADLMQAGNKFLAMGLADTAEGAANLAEMATQLGMAMGEDATASMENFALMMANQSIPRLDSFGISSSKVRERIEELMATTAGMTREAAFNQAVMEQGAITMEKVGEQSNTVAASQARIRATIANLRLEIGTAFLPIAQQLLAFFAEIIQQYGPMVAHWFSILADWLGRVLPPVIEFVSNLWEKWMGHLALMKGIWETQIKPPLMELWNALQELFKELGLGTIAWDELGAMAVGIIRAIYQLGIIGWIKSVVGVLTALTNSIRNVIDQVRRFKEWWDRVKDIRLPAWLTGHSPSPIENTLAGMREHMASLTADEIPGLTMALKGLGGGSVANDNRVYNLTANYRQEQSERSLMDDVRTLAIMTGGRV